MYLTQTLLNALSQNQLIKQRFFLKLKLAIKFFECSFIHPFKKKKFQRNYSV